MIFHSYKKNWGGGNIFLYLVLSVTQLSSAGKKGGDIFFLFSSECSTAQFSHLLFVSFSCCSRYVAFVELIHLSDHVDNVLKA